MTGQTDKVDRWTEGRRSRRATFVLVAFVGLLLVAMAGYRGWYLPHRLGPQQPIPFSHRLHAGDKQIGCFFCHPGAAMGPDAGVPPIETCMLCHQRIITDYPQIRRLRSYYDAGDAAAGWNIPAPVVFACCRECDARSGPLAWTRVFELPDYVYFDHEAHVRRGVDCGRCHGDVKAMDRLTAPREFTMGFCMRCHRAEDAPRDCATCHR